MVLKGLNIFTFLEVISFVDQSREKILFSYTEVHFADPMRAAVDPCYEVGAST